MAKTFKEKSRGDLTPAPGFENTMESVKVGAMQRIADSVEIIAASSEKMTSNYTFLQNERDKYKRWYEEEKQSGLNMCRRIAALKGTITKMKRRGNEQ